MFRNMTMLVLLVWSLGAFAERAETVDPLSDSERISIAVAENLGSQAFRHDRAAWHATDALRKLRTFRRDRRVQGWITQAGEEGITVTFIGAGEGQPLALYRATLLETGALQGEPVVLKTPQPLGEYERSAARARALALDLPFEACGKNYNTIVLPNDADGSKWIVYLFPGTTRSDVVPLGGSFRVDVDLSDETSTLRAYTRSCIELQNDPRAVALMITHLMDPVPTEVHVFWNLWANKALYVATSQNGALWALERGRIRLLQRREDG